MNKLLNELGYMYRVYDDGFVFLLKGIKHDYIDELIWKGQT